jgi:hypothetical protein
VDPEKTVLFGVGGNTILSQFVYGTFQTKSKPLGD